MTGVNSVYRSDTRWLDGTEPALARALEQVLATDRVPGGVVTFGVAGGGQRTVSRGIVAPECGSAVPDEHTWYDLASITKMVATWPLVGRAVGTGLIDLDVPVRSYLPLPDSPGGILTCRQLLCHTSGLLAETRLYRYLGSDRPLAELICGEPLISPPGDRHRYIDRGFVLLGLLLAQVYGRRLDQLAEELWQELDMPSTRYAPVPRSRQVAPTAPRFTGAPRAWGVPHDPSAALLNGVAGHAGAFSTTADLARFATHLLDGPDWLADWFAESRRPHAPIEPGRIRGLAWITAHDGRVAYHHGFTGTSLFLTPGTGRYIAVCTNAVYHGHDHNRLAPLRETALSRIAE